MFVFLPPTQYIMFYGNESLGRLRERLNEYYNIIGSRDQLSGELQDVVLHFND